MALLCLLIIFRHCSLITIPPFNIASAVLLILAQRLARRLCEFCKRPMDLPPEKDQELIEQLSEMVRMIITGSRAMAAE